MSNTLNEQTEQAKQLIAGKVKGGRIAVVFDGDCDGVAAGAIVASSMERLGASVVIPMWPDKGQSLYDLVFQQRIAQSSPDLCIVLDMGSRDMRPTPENIPTIVLDHHHIIQGPPPVDVFVSGSGQDPIPSSSLLAYNLFHDMVRVTDLDWIGSLGLAADFTIDAPFDLLKASRKKYGRKNILDTVALINAGKRSSAHAVASAFEVIRASRVPADIASCQVPGCERLVRFRREVSNEIRRVSVVPPVFAKPWALIGFTSLTQIHGLLAAKWSRRLPAYHMLTANYGYTPGRVHFSAATLRDENLTEFLIQTGASDIEHHDFAYVLGSAASGVLGYDAFGELLKRLEFPPEVHNRLKANAL